MRQTTKQRAYSGTGDRNLELVHSQSAFTHWMYDQVKPYLKGHILEIGSGIGTYSRYFRTHDRKTVLSEIDPGYLKELHKRFPHNDVVRLDMSSPKDVAALARRHKFDTIVFLNVLEHVQHDRKALQLLRTLLRPGGRIVCLVPTHPWLYNVIDKSIGHWRRYTRRELVTKVRAAGYRVERVWAFNLFAIPGWFINGSLFKKQEVNQSALRAFNTLVPIFRFIERYVTWQRIGISTIIVASRDARE